MLDRDALHRIYAAKVTDGAPTPEEHLAGLEAVAAAARADGEWKETPQTVEPGKPSKAFVDAVVANGGTRVEAAPAAVATAADCEGWALSYPSGSGERRAWMAAAAALRKAESGGREETKTPSPETSHAFWRRIRTETSQIRSPSADGFAELEQLRAIADLQSRIALLESVLASTTRSTMGALAELRRRLDALPEAIMRAAERPEDGGLKYVDMALVRLAREVEKTWKDEAR